MTEAETREAVAAQLMVAAVAEYESLGYDAADVARYVREWLEQNRPDLLPPKEESRC